MDKNTKIKELKEKADKYREKLTSMYKNFRGVKHENSLSELRYTEIKVYEDLLNSIVEEIKKLSTS